MYQFMLLEGSCFNISGELHDVATSKRSLLTTSLSPSLRQLSSNNQHGGDGEGNIGDRPAISRPEVARADGAAQRNWARSVARAAIEPR
jgi:hypothetical protein